MNKASGGDEIPVELFKILKDDAVKVLNTICQQIWKTQQWPQDWKMSVFILIQRRSSAKECLNCCPIALISHASKVMLRILPVFTLRWEPWEGLNLSCMYWPMVKKTCLASCPEQRGQGDRETQEKSVANVSQSPHKGIYFSATKRNKVKPTTTWKNLKDTLLNERNQTQRPQTAWFHLHEMSRKDVMECSKTRLRWWLCNYKFTQNHWVEPEW